MIGFLVKNSGFEDLVYQAKLCTSGSLQGVLVGSHYNRAWAVHRVVSESLERLFLTRFLTETKPDIPNLMEEFVTDPKPQMVDETLMNANKKLHDHYETFRESARSGAIGKTAQFWLLYMDLLRLQTLSHTALQCNDFGMLVHGWKSFLPMYFSMNKVNYARYSKVYIYLVKVAEIDLFQRSTYITYNTIQFLFKVRVILHSHSRQHRCFVPWPQRTT